MEFRHPSWFDEEVFGLLRDHQAALCAGDAEDELEVPFVATADWGYLRLRRPEYDGAALAEWAARVQTQDWQDCFVFFKHEDAGKGPQMASLLLDAFAAGSRRAAKPKRAGRVPLKRNATDLPSRHEARLAIMKQHMSGSDRQ
jgi:uncharacterized protein YecE (DUF72 family)